MTSSSAASTSSASRRGVLPLLILLVALLVAAAAGAWLLLGEGGQSSAQPTPPTPPTPVQASRVVRGAVTAVRQAEGLPTYVLTDVGRLVGAKPGDRLALERDGRTIIQMLVETVTEDGHGSTCRIQTETQATGTPAAPAVGDIVSLTIQP